MLVKQSTRKEILKRDNYTCQYCGKYWDERERDLLQEWHDRISIDHVVPQCEYGSNLPYNLVTSCMGCNSDKGGSEIMVSDDLLFKQATRLAEDADGLIENLIYNKGFQKEITDEVKSKINDLTSNYSFISVWNGAIKSFGNIEIKGMSKQEELNIKIEFVEKYASGQEME